MVQIVDWKGNLGFIFYRRFFAIARNHISTVSVKYKCAKNALTTHTPKVVVNNLIFHCPIKKMFIPIASI